MKGGFKIVGILSVTLLMCVLIGQGSWLVIIRKVKQNEYCQLVSFSLASTVDEFLTAESIDPSYGFGCSLTADGKTFIWDKTNKTMEVSSFRDYDIMSKQVFYDHLYRNHYLNLHLIDSLYRQRLVEKGIDESPVLMI